MLKNKLDTGFFNWMVIVFIGIFIAGMLGMGIGTIDGLISNLNSTFINVFVWVIVVFGIEFFQNGISHSTRKEIFDKQNMSAAIYDGCIKIAVAIAIKAGGTL